ncbi:MAG: CHAD domain-containing protein [Pseudohongiellaceae bacterium]
MSRRKQASALDRALAERVAGVGRWLSAYLDNPDEGAIHGVRIAIRRLEAAYHLYPESAQTPASKGYMRRLRAFFRQNGEVRDCDVLREKLLGRGLSGDDALLIKLGERRARHLADAVRQAPPLLALDEVRTVSSAPDPLPRYLHRVRKLASRFLDKRPAVIRHESDAEDVHAMRKAAKKLYYTLELELESVSEHLLETIKQFHRLSGSLHDSDVAIAFLHDNRRRSGKALLKAERRQRHETCTELQRLLSEEDWEGMLAFP